jgi:hypothetical protein
MNMTRIFLAVLYLSLDVVNTHAASLEALINSGDSLTGGSVTYSNFSGTLTAPTLPACGGSPTVLPCGVFIPSLATIDVRATETGLEISGIDVSLITPLVQQPPGVNPNIGFSMSYDVSTPISVYSMSTDIIPTGGNFIALGNTVTANRFDGDQLGVASTVRSPGCSAPPPNVGGGFGCVRLIGPVTVNASNFHVTEGIFAIPFEHCQTGPPSVPPGGGSCSFFVSASASATFSTVPEPGTGSLVLTGVIVAGMARRLLNYRH